VDTVMDTAMDIITVTIMVITGAMLRVMPVAGTMLITMFTKDVQQVSDRRAITHDELHLRVTQGLLTGQITCILIEVATYIKETGMVAGNRQIKDRQQQTDRRKGLLQEREIFNVHQPSRHSGLQRDLLNVRQQRRHSK